MGILVSAIEAGRLVDRNERVVRQHIQDGSLPAHKDERQRWRIDTDDLARVPGWVVDREQLARLELRQRRSHAGLVARTEALEGRLRAIEGQQRAILERLERLGQSGPPPPRAPREPEEEDDEDSDPDEEPDPEPPLTYRGPPTVALLDRGPDAPQAFRTRTDAARWLARHGVNALTPKDWPGWKRVTLTPVEVLRFAIERQQIAVAARNWRVSWRLVRCEDAQCVCHDWLEG